MFNDWRDTHGKVILDFLKFLNKETDQFTLKGGTALLTCYGLDRFSEGIDLDGRKRDIRETARRFCNIYGYSLHITKDTNVVKRCAIDYGNSEHRLKVEVSYRQPNRRPEVETVINSIKVYTIESLAIQKSNAFQKRDTLRDIYDLAFICLNYFDQLSETTKDMMRNALEYKGLDQLEYILATQEDPLIDKDKLEEDFLKMHDKLGILFTLNDDLVQSEEQMQTDKEIIKSRGRR